MRAGLLVVFAACYQPSAPAGAPCGDGAPCPTGQSCSSNVCILGDAAEANADACVAADRCEGATLVTCAGSVACSHGCDGDHCLTLAPSNGLSSSLLTGASADVSGDKLDFDTDSGKIKGPGNSTLRMQGEGVISDIGFTVIDGMGVFTAHSFDLGAGAAWTVGGSNTFVLFAATDVAIHGTIDVGALAGNGGPGGRSGGTTTNDPPCRGLVGLAGAIGFGEGGGGGGGATAGGNGAPSNATTFGAGGSLCASPSTIPLRGGNGGGAGGVVAATETVRGGRGGGGGGAIALVAMDEIVVDGVIGAPGDGGLSLGDGGGGGGGGGAVFLEAPSIVLDGVLTANGAGGAGPSASIGSRGHLGDATTAAGGQFAGVSGGRGGAGMASPTDGQTSVIGTTAARGGGGGGAVGRIELRSVTVTASPAAVESPPATRSTAVLQ